MIHDPSAFYMAIRIINLLMSTNVIILDGSPFKKFLIPQRVHNVCRLCLICTSRSVNLSHVLYPTETTLFQVPHGVLLQVTGSCGHQEAPGVLTVQRDARGEEISAPPFEKTVPLHSLQN